MRGNWPLCTAWQISTWWVGKRRTTAVCWRVSLGSRCCAGCLLPLVPGYWSAWYMWSPSAYPPWKVGNIFFFFFCLFVIPLLYLSPTVSWQWSGNVLLLLSLTSACGIHRPLVESAPSPLPVASTRVLVSDAVPSFAGAGAVAQTIWFLTASQLSAPCCRVAVKLTAPVVSLHSACRNPLLEVVRPELPYTPQKCLLYLCIPVSNNSALKLSLFFNYCSIFLFHKP